MDLRTKIIQKIIHINESIFFYPKLKQFYSSKLSKKNICILDVGANKGQSIEFFLKVNPKSTIDSFEPNKKLFDFLKNRYKDASNINIHNFGLSNINGELEFHENIMDETSTFELLNPESKYLAKKARVLGVSKENIIKDRYQVKVLRLSDFLADNPSAFYDVLKIDVEGHELKCLKGLFSERKETVPIRFIQLESHYDDMYLNNNWHAEIEQLLNENNFYKTMEIKHGFGEFSEIIYENKSKSEA